MIKLNPQLTPTDLLPKLSRFWARSAECIAAVERSCPQGSASPVFTVKGTYTAKGWTEWTQGFQFGSALLQFDATGDERFLELGRERTVGVMAPHLTLWIAARGINTGLHTRVYFEDEAEANETDFVLNRIMDVRRRRTLIAVRSDADGKAVYNFDIRLQGGDETVFFDI